MSTKCEVHMCLQSPNTNPAQHQSPTSANDATVSLCERLVPSFNHMRPSLTSQQYHALKILRVRIRCVITTTIPTGRTSKRTKESVEGIQCWTNPLGRISNCQTVKRDRCPSVLRPSDVQRATTSDQSRILGCVNGSRILLIPDER